MATSATAASRAPQTQHVIRLHTGDQGKGELMGNKRGEERKEDADSLSLTSSSFSLRQFVDQHFSVPELDDNDELPLLPTSQGDQDKGKKNADEALACLEQVPKLLNGTDGPSDSGKKNIQDKKENSVVSNKIDRNSCWTDRAKSLMSRLDIAVKETHPRILKEAAEVSKKAMGKLVEYQKDRCVITCPYL